MENNLIERIDMLIGEADDSIKNQIHQITKQWDDINDQIQKLKDSNMETAEKILKSVNYKRKEEH